MRRFAGPFCLGVSRWPLPQRLPTRRSKRRQPKTKVKIEDGKDMTVTGCLSRGADGSFVLSNLSGDSKRRPSYQLILEDKDDTDDYAKHVGHKVEVKGKVPQEGQRTRDQVEDEDRDQGRRRWKTESKRELKGDLSWFPVLAAKSVKMVSAVCP